MTLLFNLKIKKLNIVRIIFAIYILGFTYGTRNHIVDICNDGLLGYTYVPLPINIYWTSLTVLDPLAIILLLFSPHSGMVLSMFIMATDIAINMSVGLYYYFQTGIFTLDRLHLQICFGIFIFVTVPIAWRRIKNVKVAIH